VSTAVTLLVLTLTGPGLLYLGIRSLRTRAWSDSVPVTEALIYRAARMNAPARTAWDRRFALFHTAATLVFGSFATPCLAAVLFTIVSE